MTTQLTIIGGGLAGSEAAWQAAERGVQVRLFEMRPAVATGAHTTQWLAELVCSNSLGSKLPDRPGGVLKEEARRMGSMLLECATETEVPAGGALAVDRDGFAEAVTKRIEGHANIELVREEVAAIPDGPCIIASGPLTSPALSDSLAALAGSEHLWFFDAISPIVTAESIDMGLAFRENRYGRGETEDGDYINCPMNKVEYHAFVEQLVAAERIELHAFEEAMKSGVRAGAHTFFEGCLPVEIIAERGVESLAFGPMRPVGLTDPRTGRWAYAVLQLRQDNLAGSLFNMVGFQTNLKFPEQKRVFGMVPGLANAEYERYGQMHRNTFINAPLLLRPTLQWHDRDDLFVAGQLSGVEGYMGNIATGVLAGWNAARILNGESPITLPRETMLGSLCHYVTHCPPRDFQPMKANMGILPELDPAIAVPPPGQRKLGKRDRAKLYAARAMAALDAALAGS